MRVQSFCQIFFGRSRRSIEIILCLTISTLSIFTWCSISPCEGLHVQGTWETDTFFLFLTKFGFQKTELGEKNDTQGFIFGNVTSSLEVVLDVKKLTKTKRETSSPQPPNKVLTVSFSNGTSTTSTSTTSTITTRKPSSVSSSTSAAVKQSTSHSNSNITTTSKPNTTKLITTKTLRKNGGLDSIIAPTKVYPGTLVVLDRGYFVDYYRNRKIQDRNEACKQMFEMVSHISYDSQCFPEVKDNYLRRIPCPKGAICEDELNPLRVVKDHQFTYAIKDKNKAKFWYVSLVACYRDPKTCEWRHSTNYTSLKYDIWLVNGNPYTKNQNPLEYQFSFDRLDTVEIYLVFFVCYLILVPIQVHAVIRQRHIVPKLFTGSVALELTAVLSNVVHVLTFSLDGIGYPKLAVFGDIMDILARAIFMLILLVLAKGWAITRTELTSKPFIFTIWAVYGVVHILLYVWNQTEVDVIEDIDEYQTWPGWLILILRTIIMVWFLYELKDTMDHEHQPHKLNFFLHFGAASLVWFIYLPIIALIALQVSPLWRFKLLLGITYSADCLAFAVMTHLLWPTRSQQYFLLTSNLDTSLTDELEEFNEAPHVVNQYSSSARRPNHWYPVNYSFHDVSSPEAVSLTHANNLNNLSNVNGTTSYGDDKDNVPLIIT